MDPQNRSLMALGDWNFLAPGEHRTFLAAPTKKPAHSQDDDINGGPMRNLWLSALGELLELQQDAPTHFVPGSLTCARLDCIYIAAPSWILFASAGSASTIMHPRQTNAREGFQ